MSIQERQNQQQSLRKLAAQRLLYGQAKRIRKAGIALIVVIALLGLASSVLENQTFNQLVPLIVLIAWFLDQQILKRKESTHKTEAAIIQEDFDCFVLDLPWPTQKGIQRPTPDRVKQLFAKAESKPELSMQLQDWYTPNSIPDDPILSKIHCQRMNVWWDENLRRRWSKYLMLGNWIFLTFVFFLFVITGISFAKALSIFAANIRVFAWVWNEKRNQVEAIERADRIHRILSNFSEKTLPTPQDIRSIQDEIFEHRRSNSPVSDRLYWWDRESQENEAAKP